MQSLALPPTAPASRAVWRWLRPLAGAAVLAVLLWRLGAGPFLDGLHRADRAAVAAAVALGALSTVCSAWRWSLVATGLGLPLPLRTAVADCYRSIFLNSTLPGGVVGDVHRAVQHGRESGDVRRGIRAVVWERAAGQVVQVAIAVVVLCALPSPVRSAMPVVVAMGAVIALGGLALIRGWPGAGALRGHRGRILLASAVAVCGHLATFLVAARAAGSTAPLSRLLPLACLALLAMSVPANVGGFGPREGVAAWAFGAAGLGAAQGVATAVLYGVLVLLASLPGAAVLLVRRARG